MGRGGGAGRGDGGGIRLTKEERASPFAKVQEGVWLKAKDGRATWSVIFNPVEVSADGEAYRSYGYVRRQGSRSTSGSGMIRLRDGREVYLNRQGRLVEERFLPAGGVNLVI